MRYATLRTDSGTRAVRIEAGGTTAIPLGFKDLGEALCHGTLAEARADGAPFAVAGASYAPPVVAPRKIICVGMNYRRHLAEIGMPVPDAPSLFPKFATSFIGAHDTITLPPESSQVDWEVELAIVMGRDGRRIPEGGAMEYIAGFTVCNDVSMRDWQFRGPGPMQGKAWDRCTPIGPVLVAPEDCNDAVDLRVQTFVDERKMQEGRTSDMVFSPAFLVAYISTFLTLEAGDVILTGTPEGVGFARKPPLFLRPGQTMRTVIENIGELRNPIVDTP